MLKVENATKTFGNNSVLSGINFSLEKGKIVTIAGPSGSGKSTLLRCIQGIEKLDQGTIEIEGKTGFVFQDFQLFPHLSVMQNTAYTLKFSNKIPKNKVATTAKETLTKLGLQTLSHKMPSQLSGGQKQRVAIARALVLDPDLLLCDEPTSGLDGINAKNVAELFLNLKSHGVTMLISSHDLDFVSKVADRIIVLNDSKICKDLKVESNSHKLNWQDLLT